ncbi:permease [Ammoniphilus sp. CFH 90114]|uniref:permease n=1 Tax=Ammoniphilus sp. CFH 90114 TaxID=2493665 RepID=UPI00100E0A4E|nr:permease [Ammoniphilus sp. CFH 90114]RXT03624.1 permease [Ammoniphilus sp. CFH 90114]
MWTEVFESFLYIALELTVLFIGISFLISLLQGLVSYEKMERWMGRNHPLASAFIALGFAFVTPFCSCSTIPVVVNLLNKKVRFGIVMVFLFASPVLDPTILTLMTAILGVKVAIAYTLITSVLSIIIGFSLEKLGFESQVKQVIMKGYEPGVKKFNISLAFAETWGLMKTVYPYLIAGAAIGAIIHGAVPTEWITSYMGGDKWWLVPIAAVIGIPLYIRLSTMIPISQIMIAKGMALGPVMALMISSAGASLPELTLLNSIFKKKLVAAFVGSVFLMSTLSGFLFYII